MEICRDWRDYEILATGGGRKLERWGQVFLLRPDPQAIWKPAFDFETFPKLNALYRRSERGGGEWKILRPFPPEWTFTATFPGSSTPIASYISTTFSGVISRVKYTFAFILYFPPYELYVFCFFLYCKPRFSSMSNAFIV